MARKKPVEIFIPEPLQQFLVPIDYVVPDTRNPRRVKKGKLRGLKKAIAEFGVHRLIVANQTTKRIVVGHRQYEAMVELGATEVPVLLVDEEDAKSLRRNVLDNLAGEKVAAWDHDMLELVLDECELELEEYGWEWQEPEEPDGPTKYIVEIEVSSKTAQDDLVTEFEGRGYVCKGRTTRKKRS